MIGPVEIGEYNMSLHTHRIVSSRLTICTNVVLLAILLTCKAALAQTDTIPDPNPAGLPEHAIFHGTDVESVQVNNGNLHIEILLAEIKGRGPSYTVKFVLDTKGYWI